MMGQYFGFLTSAKISLCKRICDFMLATMATDHISKPTEADALILEAWGQGLMVGSLLIMLGGLWGVNKGQANSVEEVKEVEEVKRDGDGSVSSNPSKVGCGR
jgi:hypothetical protein